MHILILDDDRSYGDLLASACKKLGHQCVVKENPAEALAYLKNEEAVDAFFVDLDMPKVKGTVFATLVRQQGCEVPVAICTGNCTDEALIAKANRMVPVLPKIWTHADLREILAKLQQRPAAESLPDGALPVNLPAHDGEEAETSNATGDDGLRSLASGTGAVAKDQFGAQPPSEPQPRGRGSSVSQVRRAAPRVHVRCSSWEQIRKLCSDVMAGSTMITVRAQANLSHGQFVVLALALPDEMVVSIDANIVDSRTAGSDGKRPYQLDLIGFGGDEMAYLLERCNDNVQTAPEGTAPVTDAPPRAKVPLAPSTPADTRPSIPESIDSVDMNGAPSYAPKISWD